MTAPGARPGERGQRVSGKLCDAVPLCLVYTNWRGETSVRKIVPLRAPFLGGNEWHPWPTWLLPAWDVDKQVEREFALSGFAACDIDAHATIVRLKAENEALRSAKQTSDAAATYWEDEARKARAALAAREG